MASTQQEKWITLHEAVEIVSRNNGRPVNTDYVRMRLKSHKISEQGHGPGGRRNRYDREAVEKIRVKKHDFPTREVSK